MVQVEDGIKNGHGMLSPERGDGLPARRRVGALYLTIVAVVAVTVGITVGSRSGPQFGLFAGSSMLLLPLVMAPLWLITFAISRSRLRRLRERNGLVADSIPVRTSADFSSFPPEEISVYDSYTKPWSTYQLLTVTERGIELRTFPRGGASAGAALRFDRITDVVVGTVDFGDLRERGILISGTERGKSYVIGVVPVDEHSRTLKPVDDQRFRDFAGEIVSEAEETVAPSSETV